MNLKDLENIAGQHATQNKASKKSDFDVALKKGMQFLSQAKAEEYTIPDSLTKACDSLIDAINFYHSDTRPYLALAYLFCVLEDFTTAEEYAYAALQIEPQNPEIDTFIEKMQAFKKDLALTAPPTDQAFEINVPEKAPRYQKDARPPNHQELYSELERFILEKLKDLFSRPIEVEATVNPQKHKILVSCYKNLKHVIEYMEQQVDIIGEKLNVASLAEKMMPFKVLKGRYVKAIKTSNQLMEIQDTIELWSFKTDKQVQVVNQKLTMSALTYGRVDVHRMMDGCDLIADKLDHLYETEKIDISLVENSYEKLTGLVESLSTMLEDSGAVQENKNKLMDILD